MTQNFLEALGFGSAYLSERLGGNTWRAASGFVELWESGRLPKGKGSESTNSANEGRNWEAWKGITVI